MQIYMKDGKALWMNEKAITPKKTAGETWVLNDGRCYDFPINGFTINFISNNINFNKMNIKGSMNGHFCYDNISVAGIELSLNGYDIVNWKNEAYRTITFLESPTGDLLTWLQANGTKQ